MDSQKIAGYLGAAVAIGFGVALLWIPPTGLAGQAGTVGAAFSFVTGGLAAVGISVTVPAVKAAAYRTAMSDARTAQREAQPAPKPRKP